MKAPISGAVVELDPRRFPSAWRLAKVRNDQLVRH